MENLALIESFSEFKDDKLIDRVTLMAILEEVFRNTLKRKFGTDDNFDIIINPVFYGPWLGMVNNSRNAIYLYKSFGLIVCIRHNVSYPLW